jgi:hypothetical protein
MLREGTVFAILSKVLPEQDAGSSVGHHNNAPGSGHLLSFDGPRHGTSPKEEEVEVVMNQPLADALSSPLSSCTEAKDKEGER